MAEVNKTSHELRVTQTSNAYKSETQQVLLGFFFFPAFPPSLLPFQAGKKPRSRFVAVKHTNTGSVFVNGICLYRIFGLLNPTPQLSMPSIRQGRVPFSEAFARIGTDEPAPRSTEALQIFQCLTHQ